MNISNNNKCNFGEAYRETVGYRFHLFRKAISKERDDIAVELNVSLSVVAGFEDNTITPQLPHLNTLYAKFRLNINWLLTGVGDMFLEEPKDHSSTIPESHKELLHLMQVPAVKHSIDGLLTQLKALLELEKHREDHPEDQ